MAEQAATHQVGLPNPNLQPQDLIASFTTSRGSIYTYDEEGHTTRFKVAIGEEQPKQDLTVFIEVTPRDIGIIATQYLLRGLTGTRVEVIEHQPDNTINVVTDIREVIYPDRLMVATVRGSKVMKSKKASIVPRVGSYVFDSRRFGEEGAKRTERHLGHKVADISYKR